MLLRWGRRWHSVCLINASLLHYKAPVSRGRGHSLSSSAPAGLNLMSQTNKKQSLSFNKPYSNPVTTASSPTQHSPAVTTELAATKSTLFSAVVSRSANVAFNPNTFTYHHLKADLSKSTASAHSSSSTCPVTPTKDKSTNMTTSPKLTKTVTAVPNVSDTAHTASAASAPRTTTTDSNVLTCSDANSKTTASHTSAPGKSTAPTLSISNGAAPPYDGLAFAASGTQSAHRSPERSNKPTRPRPGDAHIHYYTQWKVNQVLVEETVFVKNCICFIDTTKNNLHTFCTHGPHIGVQLKNISFLDMGQSLFLSLVLEKMFFWHFNFLNYPHNTLW